MKYGFVIAFLLILSDISLSRSIKVVSESFSLKKEGTRLSPPHHTALIHLSTDHSIDPISAGIRWTWNNWFTYQDSFGTLMSFRDNQRHWQIAIDLPTGIQTIEYAMFSDTHSGRVWGAQNQTVSIKSHWSPQPHAGGDPNWQSNVEPDLSPYNLLTWGSSVCDGWGGTQGWVWQLENLFKSFSGPSIIHGSTPGHKTSDKFSELERLQSADFVMICLSLGNQGLDQTQTQNQAQQIGQWFLHDLVHADGYGHDIKSLVKEVTDRGAIPIITLPYPKGNYSVEHCRTLLATNIHLQSLPLATINHLSILLTNSGAKKRFMGNAVLPSFKTRI